ncbi:cyclic lactone autoinducer peptide [Paenibacillus sp. FSL E2-0178]
MKNKFILKFMTTIGAFLSAVALVQTSTASWTFLHSEPVPEDMK